MFRHDKQVVITNLTVPCATCGENITVKLHSDGTIDNAHYGSVLIIPSEKVADSAVTVEEKLNKTVPTDCSAVIYTECADCCPHCNK